MKIPVVQRILSANDEVAQRIALTLTPALSSS